MIHDNLPISRPKSRVTIALLFVGILAAGVPTASGQISSTSSGGEWGNEDTWSGGVVPEAHDDVVITTGATVTAANELYCHNLTIESGATLSGSAIYTVVGGDLVNRGTLRDFLYFTVLGAVQNESTMGGAEEFSLWTYVYGSVENRGFWGGKLDMSGDGRRTIRGEGISAEISVGRSSFYVDPIPPRILLEGDNYFPSFRIPLRGGDLVVVAPGGRFEIDPERLEASMDAENGYWLQNHGRVVLMHRGNVSEEEPPHAITHGGRFRFAGATNIDSLRATAYGGQAPRAFPNALHRWWEVETWPAQTGARYDYIRLEFAESEFSDSTYEDLALYHSSDDGEIWSIVEDVSLQVRDFPTVRGETYLEVEATGELPANGHYAVASDAPSALRTSINAQIVGRDQIRLGGPAAEYLINYENTGTTPLYEGLLRIDTEGGAYIDRVVTSNPSPLSREPVEIEADSLSLYEDSTSAMLKTPPLAPGESRTLSLYLKAVPVDDEESAGKGAVAAPAIGIVILKGLASGYLIDLAAHALEETLADPCAPVTGSDGSLRKAFGRTDDKWNPFGDSESPWLSVANNGASQLAQDGLIKDGLGKANALNDLKTIADGVTNGFDRYEENHGSIYAPRDCDGDPPPRGADGFRGRKELTPVNSWDPNAKVGPEGAGEAGFITSAGTFTYQILFENLAEATAPAYRIVIVDTLADTFISETVQRTRESHPGFRFTRDGNILRWEIEGIELPPNVSPPEGEGFVEFTVEVRQDLPSGTGLPNRAQIVFDANPPILTNVHLNTLDMLPPVTVMTPLPQSSTGDSLDVSWFTDDGELGSGVSSTMLYMSTDGGLFEPLGLTTRSSLRVPVTSGRSYAFYALARDVAGNAEASPPEAVQTAVTVGTGDESPHAFALHPAYPNPFNPSTRFNFEVATFGRVSVRVYDVIGRHVARLDFGQMGPGTYTRSLDLTRFASGVYFFEFRVHGEAGLLFRAVEKAILAK